MKYVVLDLEMCRIPKSLMTNDKVEHLGVTLGDVFRRLQLQVAV